MEAAAENGPAPPKTASTASRPTLASDGEVEVAVAADTTCDYSCCAPDGCQRLAVRPMMLFWMCWCTFTQSMMVNGFVNSVITTLERRYRLNSKESGAIASLYDVGVTLVLIPLSYFGGSWRRMRVLAWGMLIMGTGAFLFALPQATSGDYQYKNPISPVCYRNGSVSYDSLCKNNDASALNNYKYLFWLAHLLIGVGASPLYTLGTAYLDDNLSTKSSAVYLGIFYTMSLLGPGAGYLGASYLLEVYVDIGRDHPGLTTANKELWVGAWWIGFVLTGFMSVTAILPLYGFPRELPGTAEIRANKRSESFGDSDSKGGSFKMTKKDIVSNIVVLVTNPTFMFISLSGFLESMLAAGFSTFGPKYLESVFGLEAGSATRMFGFVLVPAGGLGMIFGGLVIRFLDLKMRGILRFQSLFAVIVLPFLLIFLLPCGAVGGVPGIAGLTQPYSGSGVQTTFNLSATCNADCKCLFDSSLFEASCGLNNMTYYSPCYAGCVSTTGNGYTNCSCIPANVSSGTADHLARGSCTVECKNLPYFMVVFGLIIFCVFSITTPSLSSTLRSVSERQKTFALGIQWLIVRILGTIPGPIIFGALIDLACSLWNDRCGVRGSCGFYDGPKLRDIILTVGFVIKTLSAICLITAWLTYKTTDGSSETTGESAKVGPQEKQDQAPAADPLPNAGQGYDNPALESTPV